MNGHVPGERWSGLAALLSFARRASTTPRTPRLDGGLALARDKPGLDAPIVDVPLPRWLVLPLVGHRGRPLVPTVRVGQRVARGESLAPGLPSGASGRIVAIEPRPIAHPAGHDAPCVVVETDAFGQTPRKPLPALDTLTLERLTECGVGGLGGAGYPTAGKLADATAGAVHTLVVNGAECEPGIACDEALMPVGADEIVAGALALARLAGARRCLIVVESDKRAAGAALRTAIDSIARTNTDACRGNDHDHDHDHGNGGGGGGGGGGRNDRDRAGRADTRRTAIGTELRLLDIPPVYPSGAERLLLRLATGIDVPAGERPARHGLLCVNVATAIAAHRARLGEPSLERIVTVAGNRAVHPCNARVTFGTPIADVLDATGQGTRAHDTRRRIGGPLSGFDVTSERVPVTATTNRVALEPPRIAPPALPCIRCAACSDVCPVELLPQELLRHARSGDEVALDRGGLDACLECGCCDLVCPSSIELTATFRHARGVRLDARRREHDADLAEARFRRREARLAARDETAAIAPGAVVAAARSSASRRPDRSVGERVRGSDTAPNDSGDKRIDESTETILADPADVPGTDSVAELTTRSAARSATNPTNTSTDASTDTSTAASALDPVAAALARAQKRRRERRAGGTGRSGS